MQVSAKVFIIVCIVKLAEGELTNCESKNMQCKVQQTKLSESDTTDLSSLIKEAIKYFSDFNQKYDTKINAIESDIDSIRNVFQAGGKQDNDCKKMVQQLPEASKVESITKSSSSLYDRLWVIIQRRQEGAVNFYRSWVHYVEGFGNPFREFFIGLDKIHYLTNSRPHELLIKLEDYKGKLKYALYNEFLIGNETEKYQLKKVGNYSGNAGDYLRAHEGMYFSTRDRDNDASKNVHCAQLFHGGWWYHNCMTSNLNGPFRTRYEVNKLNMTWGNNNETRYKIIQMMIRSKPRTSED